MRKFIPRLTTQNTYELMAATALFEAMSVNKPMNARLGFYGWTISTEPLPEEHYLTVEPDGTAFKCTKTGYEIQHNLKGFCESYKIPENLIKQVKSDVKIRKTKMKIRTRGKELKASQMTLFGK